MTDGRRNRRVAFGEYQVSLTSSLSSMVLSLHEFNESSDLIVIHVTKILQNFSFDSTLKSQDVLITHLLEKLNI